MAKKNRSEKQKKIVWGVVGVVVIILLAVVAGFSTELRTQLVPGGGDSGPQDWSPVDVPELATDDFFFNEEDCVQPPLTSIGPGTPKPTSSSISVPLSTTQALPPPGQVRGTSKPAIGYIFCNPEDAPEPNFYSWPSDIGQVPREFNRIPIGQTLKDRKNGEAPTASEILTVACLSSDRNGNTLYSLPGRSDPNSAGFAKVDWLSPLHWIFVLDETGGPSNNVLRAVHPSAPQDDVNTPTREDQLPVKLYAEMWQLDKLAIETLRQSHPMLRLLAKLNLEQIEHHELGHWNIYFDVLGRLYLKLANAQGFQSFPVGPNGRDDIFKEVLENFYYAWGTAQDVEDELHWDFHQQVAEVDHRGTANVPVAGLEDVECSFVEDLSVDVTVHVGGLLGNIVKFAIPELAAPMFQHDCQIECTNTYFYQTGVALVAVPANTASKFERWEGESCPCNGQTGETCTFVVPTTDEDIECWARFAK